MSIETIIAIVGGALSIAAVFIAAARFFSENQRRIEQLTNELKTFKDQSELLRTTIRRAPDGNSADIYNRIAELSAEAAKAVLAEIQSVSIPTPTSDPSHLKIIYSSDPEAAKVVGREFPINKGMAGWVFQNQAPYFQNRVASDPRHLTTIDKAANTNYGEGAILTIPLTSNRRCLGVAQFLKSKGGTFKDEDVAIAQRFAPGITRLLLDLETNPQEDIPSIARGNITTTAILFTDISRFSKIIEHIPLDVTVTLLNEYYNRLLPYAISRSGKLQEYVGDGFYISFTLDSPAASARAAASCALDMQKEFVEIVQSWIEFEHPVTPMNTHRIGIATGTVYTGFVGHPKERREKLIGSTINLAAHLCEEGPKEGGIIICAHTADLLSRDSFGFKPITVSAGKHFQLAVTGQ